MSEAGRLNVNNNTSSKTSLAIAQMSIYNFGLQMKKKKCFSKGATCYHGLLQIEKKKKKKKMDYYILLLSFWVFRAMSTICNATILTKDSIIDIYQNPKYAFAGPAGIYWFKSTMETPERVKYVQS